MKKVKGSLVIAIIILLIVLTNAVYMLWNADRTVTDNTLILILLGLFLVTIIFAIIIIKAYHSVKIKPEKVLLLLMPIFCILLTIAMPVGRGHDEHVHWYKAFEISEGTLISSISEKYKISVADLPDRGTTD